MYFWFALDSPNADLWNIDLLDTYLDLLDADNPSKNFVCLQYVLKTSSRHVIMSWRRLQRKNFSSFKTSSRRLQDVLENKKLLRWRRLQDVLKAYPEDVFKTSWRQTKCLLVISVSNKSKCVSNKSMFHKSISDKPKANPKSVT